MKSSVIGAGSMLALSFCLSLPITTSAQSLDDCHDAWTATLECIETNGLVIDQVICSRSQGTNSIWVVPAGTTTDVLQAWSSKKQPKGDVPARCHVESAFPGCEPVSVEARIPGRGYRLWNTFLGSECQNIAP